MELHSKDEPAQSAARKMVGGFEVLRKIGSGGMGTVYLARQVSMARDVALKILSPNLARNKNFVERFLREARAAARLSHRNIVQAIDAGFANGYYYFAMELVEGRTLLEEFRACGGPMPELRALEIVRDVANALHHAHAQANIIHRDVKPENILIASDRTAKLADLGLARETTASGGSGLTQTGTTLGTPNYISPEQVRGEADLDGRTDVYSLGATLYHLLAGTPPYIGGSSAEVMAKHLTEPVPDLRKVNPEVSAAAAAIVRRAIAKDRNQRYPTALAMAEAVEQALKGGVHAAAHHAVAGAIASSGAATIQSSRRAFRKRARKGSLLPYVTVLAVAAVLVGVLVLALLQGEPSAKPPVSKRPAVGSEPAKEPRKPEKPPAPVPAPPKPIPHTQPVEPPPDPVRDKQKEADDAFILLRDQALSLEKSGDYDGAIAVYEGISADFKDLLRERAGKAVELLKNTAESTIKAVIDKAQKLADDKKPAEGLAVLEDLDDVKYVPLDGAIKELRAKLEAERTRLDALEQERAMAQAKESVRKLIAANGSLYDTYLAKCKKIREDRLDKLRGKYGGDWVRIDHDIKSLTNKIGFDRRSLIEAQIAYNTPAPKGKLGPHRPDKPDKPDKPEKPEWLRNKIQELKTRIDQTEKELEQHKVQQAKLAETIKSEKKRILDRYERRAARIKAVYEQNKTALLRGDQLTVEQITARDEAALKTD